MQHLDLVAKVIVHSPLQAVQEKVLQVQNHLQNKDAA